MRSKLRCGANLAVIGLLAGCASLAEGNNQDITVLSTPEKADCVFKRNGDFIGAVVTPGSLKVRRTKYPIEVTCAKDGYETATIALESGSNGFVWGNLALGGGAGWLIDSAYGADNEYQGRLKVTLPPKDELLPAPIAEDPAP